MCIVVLRKKLRRGSYKNIVSLLILSLCLIILLPLFLWYALVGSSICMGSFMTQKLMKVAMSRSNEFMNKYKRYPLSFKDINIESSRQTHYTLYLINGSTIDQVGSSDHGWGMSIFTLPDQFNKCLSGEFCIYAVMDNRPEHKELDVLYIDSGMKIKSVISGYQFCRSP